MVTFVVTDGLRIEETSVEPGRQPATAAAAAAGRISKMQQTAMAEYSNQQKRCVVRHGRKKEGRATIINE